MEVDYVIVYRFASTSTSHVAGNGQMPAHHCLAKATAIHQYQKLIETLAAIGLIAEVRNGEKESMLIFVKLASDKHLYSEVYRSRSVIPTSQLFANGTFMWYVERGTGFMVFDLQRLNRKRFAPLIKNLYILRKDFALSTK